MHVIRECSLFVCCGCLLRAGCFFSCACLQRAVMCVYVGAGWRLYDPPPGVPRCSCGWRGMQCCRAVRFVVVVFCVSPIFARLFFQAGGVGSRGKFPVFARFLFLRWMLNVGCWVLDNLVSFVKRSFTFTLLGVFAALLASPLCAFVHLRLDRGFCFFCRYICMYLS